MPGVPRKARADNSVVPRPGAATSRSATTHGAVRRCRSAHRRTSWRTTRQRTGETSCRPTSSRTSHRRHDPDPGYPVAPGLLPPGVQTGPGTGAASTVAVYPASERRARRRRRTTAWIPPAPYPNAWPPPPVPPAGDQSANPPPVFAGPYGPAASAAAPRAGAACAAAAELPPRPGEPATGQRQPAYGTYDQNTGVFVDPAGGTGVYAPGVADMRPQENWLDLMLYPRQT